MKRLLVIIIALFISSVVAGDKVNKTLNVSAEGSVEIRNVRGKIEIHGWDKNQVSVKGELDDLTEKFVFSQDGDRIIIKVVIPSSNTNSKSGRGSKLKIYVPQNFSLLFNGVSTDLTISKILGGVDVNSVSGEIDASNIGKRTYINNVSGDIELKSINGSIEISTVSGNVVAKVSSSRISVSGVSSDITFNTKNIESAKLSTVSGDAKLYGTLVKNGEIKMNNVSGDSYFYANGDLNAQVSLETGPGGDIVNNYSADKPTSSFIGSEKLKFTAGKGDGSIRMYTVSGEIGLKAD